MFDAIDKQQLAIDGLALLAGGGQITLGFNPVVGGTAEHAALQRNQLQSDIQAQAWRQGFKLLVGLSNRTDQVRLQLLTGVPSACGTGNAGNYR